MHHSTHVLDHLDRHVHFLVRRLERGEVDFAVSLRCMRIAGPEERAFDEHRNVKRRAFRHVADVEISGIASWRHRAVLTGLGAGDADRAGKRRQWNFDPRRELGDLAVEIEIEILNLALRKFAWKLAEHAGDVEVGAIGARHDLVDAHLEYVTGFGALDIDRARQRVRTAAGKVGAQFLDLLDGRPRHHLIVRMHHCLEDDRIARIDTQDGWLGVVEPAPLCRFHRRRQKVNLAGVSLGRDGP